MRDVELGDECSQVVSIVIPPTPAMGKPCLEGVVVGYRSNRSEVVDQIVAQQCGSAP